MRSGKAHGFIQLPLLVGLLLMVVALPVASRLVSQNQTNQGRATNYKCCQYGCASNCVELSSCDSSHPINCGAVGITGNAMCGSHTSGSSWCEGSNKKSCNNGSIDSQNCGSNGCSNNTCNSAPPPTSAPETQTCAIKTYSGCRGTTHVCNATRQVTIKKTENCPGPDCSADTYDDPSCGYKKPNCVPNTNCCGSTQNAGTCSDGCNGTISCTGAHPPTSTPVLTITPLPTVSVTLKHCCDISNSRCHDQPECGGEYPVELGGGVNATIAPVATPIVCTPLTTCAATTCTTSKCWTGCNNQDGTGIYVAGTLDCAPTIAACTPNSSCASTTCLGQTCTDACNNHYPGTKNCVLSGLDDGVPCTASTCSQCKHGSFADNGSPTGNFCGSARPTASTTTCDGQPLDTTQCAGPDGFNICTSTGWVHHPCASGMQCLGNHCDTAIPSPTPTIELHPGASKVLASPATFEANEKVNTTFSDCQGANMAITVKCVIASTGCTGSSYEAGCVAEKLGCKENPELPACAQISYVRPYSNSPCKQDENSNACQNEKMMNKVAWGVMLAPVAVVAVPVVAAAAPEVAAIGLAAETASTALSSFLYAHGTALAASGGALGTVVTGAGAVVSNPYVQTALTGSAYVAALSVCQQNWYSSDCAAAMAGMNEGGGIREAAESVSKRIVSTKNLLTQTNFDVGIRNSDTLVFESNGGWDSKMSVQNRPLTYQSAPGLNVSKIPIPDPQTQFQKSVVNRVDLNKLSEGSYVFPVSNAGYGESPLQYVVYKGSQGQVSLSIANSTGQCFGNSCVVQAADSISSVFRNNNGLQIEKGILQTNSSFNSPYFRWNQAGDIVPVPGGGWMAPINQPMTLFTPIQAPQSIFKKISNIFSSK